MNTSSPTPDWRSIDPDRLRKATDELVDIAGSYHDTDPDRAAEMHSVAADLYRLAAMVRAARRRRDGAS